MSTFFYAIELMMKASMLNLVAYGGIAFAGFILFNAIPGLSFIPQKIRYGLAGVALLASAYSFGNLDGLDRTKDELNSLKQQIEINERVLSAASARESISQQEIEDLNELLKEIEVEFNDGVSTTSCAADENYTFRMNSILSKINR